MTVAKEDDSSLYHGAVVSLLHDASTCTSHSWLLEQIRLVIACIQSTLPQLLDGPFMAVKMQRKEKDD